MYFCKSHTQRPNDDFGNGAFGAPRTKKNKRYSHTGIDYCAEPGEEVTAPVAGTVTKLGFLYADDPSYLYVEITSADNYQHRIFYVNPSVCLGEVVAPGDIIGAMQDIAKRYAARGFMYNHFHYQIKDTAGKYINPEGYT